jgi:patatin-like phospholipase
MITPDSPERLYSTRLRTAVVITGSGTAGAYHAGVLRALHEAGIRIDLVAGRGAGAIAAVFAAVDGGARLWDASGIWKRADAQKFYGWRRPLRAAGWALCAAAAILAFPLALLALAVLTGLVGLLLTLVGLEGAGAAVTAAYGRWVATLFAPELLPTFVPRLVLFAVLLAVAIVAIGSLAASVRSRVRRRTRQGGAWRMLGAPLDAAAPFNRAAAELWNLIRGAAPIAAPPPTELAHRYVELLSENLGQPGFRELLLTVHDLDARRDLVFALLAAPHRARFFGRTVLGDAAARQAEAFDLSGVARDHAFDALSAALAVPIATDAHLVTFSPEGPWRGETHRVCDRPGALGRLLEEVAFAGAEQVVIVSSAPPPARAHELSASRADVRGRAGEQLAAFESAALRDALEHFAGRFAGLYVIRPAHNPLGPLDFGGVYDERSDRVHTLAELVDRGYEDAYRQFIEPVVAASGEQIAAVKG